MAKNNEDVWVGTKDYSDPVQLNRMIKQHFDDARRNYLKEIGNEQYKDLDQRRYNRRIEAVTAGLKTAREMIGEDYPDYPGTSYFEEDWAYLNSITNNGYDQIDAKSDLILGASLWILDVLYAHRLLYSAEKNILPKFNEDEIYDMPEMFMVMDFSFSDLMIMKVRHVLLHRNDDCKVYRQKDDMKRTILDEATVRGKQNQDVPSRKTYDDLIALIPEEEIESAVNAFKEKYWQLARIFFASLRENHRQRDEQMKRHDRLAARMDRLGDHKGRHITITTDHPEEAARQAIQTFRDFTNAMERCCEVIDEGVTAKEEMSCFLMDYFSMSQSTRKDYYPAEFVERMKSFQIENPYQLCFAILYLADHNDDLIWMYYFGTTLASMVADVLPWRVEYDDFLPQTSEEENRAEKLPLNLYETVYEDNEADEIFRSSYNLAQLMYEHTGVVLPRSLDQFDWIDQTLDQNFGICEEDRRVMRLCMTMMDVMSRRYEGESAGEDDPQNQNETAADTLSKESVENLRKQITALSKENKALKESAWHVHNENAKLHDRLERVIRENKEDHEELARLREVIFMSQNPEKEKEDPGIQLPYETEERIVVCGGHDSFVRELSRMITGNIRFLNNVRINEDLIRNAGCIWIQTNALSHSEYYKVTSLCRRYDIPMYYFLFASARKCAEQIVERQTKKR